LFHIFKTEKICRRGNTLVSLESGEKNPLPQLEAPMATPTPATPTPSEDEQTHDADAWDPNSSVILNPEVPDWLADEAFRGIRVKLQYHTQLSSPFLEFCGMEEGSAKVRDGTRLVSVPLATLQAIPPTWQGDIVTSFAIGETYGKLYKLRAFRSDFCVLRGYGEKTGRKEKNFTILMHKLAQVFPPLR
jgi:hypothetical protein